LATRKGPLQGAHTRTIGKFEYANGGALFLDEISVLRSDLQAKLLRVLQEREIERIGSNKPIKVDIRVISATNTNLEDAVMRGKFRQDLYFRLNVIPISIPPLRERKEDIPLEILMDSGQDIQELEPRKVGLIKIREAIEKRIILNVLEATQWNQTETAKILKVNRNTLIEKAKQLGILMKK
jgi:transcriptional regulator with GAF, ATPase, and Fis domain